MSSLIKPLQLGNLSLPTNLIQGPLAGYSCAPMRRLVASFSGAAFCATEMLSANSLATQKYQPKRYLYKDPDEGLLCYQLSGNDKERLARATARVCAHGADLIDLNCGCPQPKIRKKGHGSSLLAQPEQLHGLLQAMRAETDKPLSAKIRVDGDSGEQFNVEVAQAIESAGVDYIVVHGRHWRERYDVPCRVDQIAALVKQVNCPVIANGDVLDYGSLMRCLQSSGADGVMVSRASLGKPWLFAQIQAQANGADFTVPDVKTRKRLFFEHVQGLSMLDGEYKALLQARKLIGYYFTKPLDLAICDIGCLHELRQGLALPEQ